MTDNDRLSDPYPSLQRDPREFRSSSANRTAALAVIIGLAIAVIALALFT